MAACRQATGCHGNPCPPGAKRERAGCPRLHFALWFYCFASDLGLPPPLLDRHKSDMLLSPQTSLLLHGLVLFVPPPSREGRVSASLFSRLGLPCPSCVHLRPQLGAVCVCVSSISFLFVCLRPSLGLCLFVSLCVSLSLSAFLCLSLFLCLFMLCLSITLFLSLLPSVLCSVTQSCLTLCNPMDCSPPGSSVHGILQARTLEWVVVSSSRRSSQLRN